MGEAIRLLTLVLTPFAPHVADEIAEALRRDSARR